jgi:hypothetical protein
VQGADEADGLNVVAGEDGVELVTGVEQGGPSRNCPDA